MYFTQTNDFVKIIVNVLQMSNQVAKRTFWVGNETKYDLLKLFLHECILGKRCFVDSVQWVLWPQRETRPGVSAASLVDRFVDYAIRCKTCLWNIQYNARQVCRICNTMQDKSVEYAIRCKSVEYAIQCKTSRWNMQYDARQVCGICNTMQNRSVKQAIRCQTNIPMQQHSKLYVHIECTAWRVPVSTEGSTRSLALTSTAQCYSRVHEGHRNKEHRNVQSAFNIRLKDKHNFYVQMQTDCHLTLTHGTFYLSWCVWLSFSNPSARHLLSLRSAFLGVHSWCC